MAGGLGTRMRSATPKHLHPLLGRRMVDWVFAAAGPLGPDPLVVVDLARDALPPSTASTSPCRSARSGPATPCARAQDGARRRRRGARPLRRHAAAQAELLEELVASHRRDDAAATVLSFQPADVRAYGRIVRDEAGALEAIVEARDATPEQLAIREANSSIYVFRASALWPALERLTPTNAQGELYLTDAVRAARRRPASRVARRTSPPTRSTPKGSIRAPSSRPRAPSCATGSTSRTCSQASPSSTRRRPGSTPAVDLEPDATIHPFTVLRGATPVAEGAEIGPHAVLVDADDRPAGDCRAVLLPSSGHGARARREGGHVRGDQELADRRRRQGAAPLVCRRRRDRRATRTSARDRSPRTSRTSPARPRDARRSAATSGSPSTLCSLLRSLLATTFGRLRAPSSPTTFRQRPRRLCPSADDQGRTRWKAGRLSRRCPGLELLAAHEARDDGRTRDRRCTPQKRLMVFAGRSHPRARAAHRRAARSRARRGHAQDVRERRDLLPLRSSPSAAPTSSSSRPGASRSTAT